MPAKIKFSLQTVLNWQIIGIVKNCWACTSWMHLLRSLQRTPSGQYDRRDRARHDACDCRPLHTNSKLYNRPTTPKDSCGTGVWSWSCWRSTTVVVEEYLPILLFPRHFLTSVHTMAHTMENGWSCHILFLTSACSWLPASLFCLPNRLFVWSAWWALDRSKPLLYQHWVPACGLAELTAQLSQVQAYHVQLFVFLQCRLVLCVEVLQHSAYSALR